MMGRTKAGRQLERLFGVGAVGGQSDAELLERFAAGDEESAGAAFEAIVERHGPMVRRVCRAVLRDAHAAEDAFQATFLVLARRAEALGDRDRLENWLYGVAIRTSRKARVATARRAARDRIGASRRPEAVGEPSGDDGERGRVLHEEIERLPGAYRAAVVACYLEGLTHAEAAGRLRLAESTVRGRLARARKLLGRRLSRRGVTPAVGLLGTVEIPAPMPGSVVRSLARDALLFARSSGPATPAAVASTAAAIAQGVLRSMWLPSIKTVVMTAALAVDGIGLTAAFARGRPSPVAVAVTYPVPDPAPPPQDTAEKRPKPARKPTTNGPSVSPELAKRAHGPIVRAVPISKDCMILAYLPNQNVGHVDNLGLANNGGGVRILVDWPSIPAEEARDPDRRFVVALYSRKTTSNPPAGRIQAFELLRDWPEMAWWSRHPRYEPEPFATYPFKPGEGWKLFDVTPMVRAQAEAGRTGHGILLRFLSEDFNEPGSWSGYAFVSREGAGEWVGRHPLLLVVADAKPKS